MTDQADVRPKQRSNRLIRLKEVQQLVPLGRSTIYDRMHAGTFPKQVDLGGGIVAWREQEVLDWMASLPTLDQKAA